MTAPVACISRRCGTDVTSLCAGCHNRVTSATVLAADVTLHARNRLRPAEAIFALSIEALGAPLDAYDEAHLEINGGCASVVRFDLVAMGQVTRLTVNHQGLDPGGWLLKVITPGWPMILLSLKSLVETGEPLEFRLSA